MSDATDQSEIDAALYRSVLGHYPTGVTLVSAIDDDGPFAMVIGSFGSVSLDPPLVQFMPTTNSNTWARIEATGRYCVNVLGSDQLEVCNSFFVKDVDPFDAIDWVPGPTGSPTIPGCVAWIDCDIDAAHLAGDHYIVVGAVRGLEIGNNESGPLLFFRGGYGQFGPLDTVSGA